MKATLLLLLIALTQSVCGQGTVQFSNTTATRIFYTTASGGTAPVPVGSQFSVELLFARDGTTAAEFHSVAVRIGALATFGPVPGLFSGGGRTIQGIAPAGGFGLFQVRAWETAYPDCGLGESGIMRINTGDPTTNPAEPAARLTDYGFASFTVSSAGEICPEPSTYALAVLGLVAFYVFRGRNRLH